jgi:hypothetical protein
MKKGRRLENKLDSSVVLAELNFFKKNKKSYQKLHTAIFLHTFKHMIFIEKLLQFQGKSILECFHLKTRGKAAGIITSD